MDSIQAVTHSTVSDEFVIHVPSEYDYRLMGPRKIEAIEWLQSAREELEGDPMPVRPSSQVILKDVCLTRPEAENRKGEKVRKVCNGRTDEFHAFHIKVGIGSLQEDSLSPKKEASEGEGPNYQSLKESALSGDALEPIAEDDGEGESEEDNKSAGNNTDIEKAKSAHPKNQSSAKIALDGESEKKCFVWP